MLLRASFSIRKNHIPSKTKEGSMNTAANKSLVKLFLSHFENSSANKILEMMSDDATWWVNGKPHLFSFAGLKTKSEMISVFGELFGFFEGGLKMNLKNSIGEGDMVAAEVQSLGVAKTGKLYENEYHMLFRIRDGKIAEVREYTDPMHAVEVMTE
jgi:ketosteroid isomerase-like protein